MPSCENPAFVVDHLLDVRQLTFRPRPRRRRDLTHKAQCLRRGSRHLIGQRPAGVISGSQQLSLLRADRRQPQYQVTRIMLIALLIAGPAGGEEILPRLPVAQRKQLRLLGGIGQRQQPAVAKPSFTRCVSRRRYLLIAQASQLMPVINHQAAAFCRSQQSLLELTLQRSRFGVQCAQRRLLLGSQRRPGVNKTLPRQGQETIGLAVQRQRVALLVDAVHALKQGRIKPDVIPQLGEFGGKLFIQ